MEAWKPIVGYEGNYEVSDLGRIKNVKRGKILIPQNARGYRRVDLCKNGVRKLIQVHKMVCAAFIGPCPENQEINHKNGVRDDNRLENLEYLTRQNNALHARRVLHRCCGEKHPRARLSNEAILEIINLYASGLNQSQIARTYSVTPRHICQIVNGKSRLSG